MLCAAQSTDCERGAKWVAAAGQSVVLIYMRVCERDMVIIEPACLWLEYVNSIHPIQFNSWCRLTTVLFAPSESALVAGNATGAILVLALAGLGRDSLDVDDGERRRRKQSELLAALQS